MSPSSDLGVEAGAARRRARRHGRAASAASPVMLAAWPSLALVLASAACARPAPLPEATAPGDEPVPVATASATAVGSIPAAGGPVGAVTLDEIDAASAEPQLGRPASKRSETWGVDGVTYTTWQWPGVVLTTSPDGAAHSVTCEAPCALRTKLGVGVGSTTGEVEAAYGAQIDRRESSSARLVVGEAHGGIFFDLKDDRVARIFVGAAAE